jgi:hypothetical protein
MVDEWTIDYNAHDFTAVFQDLIWHEIWRPFPGLRCVATAAEFTFYTNEDGTAHYFTIEREEED